MTEQKEMIEFDKCAARVIEIQEAGNFIPDMTTKKGYEASKRFVLDHTTPARTDLASAHKAAKAYWLAGGKAVDKKKNEILQILVDIQQPHQDAYKAVDQAEKNKKAKFEQDLNDKIEEFNTFCHSVHGLSSESITEVIQSCGEIDTEEGFYHKKAEAAKARLDALEFLNDALSNALKHEAEIKEQQRIAEENRIRQAEIDKQQEAMRIQQEEMDKKQREIERKENEAKEKEQLEAAEKQRVIDEREAAEREKQAAIEREAYAVKKAEEAAEQARLAEKARQEQLAEEQRIKDEKRAANNRHVTKIKKQAKESLLAIGLSEDDAIKVVQSLSKGEIKNCSINY